MNCRCIKHQASGKEDGIALGTTCGYMKRPQSLEKATPPGTDRRLTVSELSISNTPPAPGPELWIKRLKTAEVLACVILSEELWGCHYHWTGKTSTPHTLPANECVGCNHQFPMKWHGYFHIMEWPSRRQFFLELTPFAVHQLESKSLLTTCWRGNRFQFKRGNGAHTRLQIEFLGPPVGDMKLPEARTPEKELRTLWGLPSKNGTTPGSLPGVDVGHWI